MTVFRSGCFLALALLVVGFATVELSPASVQAAAPATTASAKAKPAILSYKSVASPLDLLKSPEVYKNQGVLFEGEFSSFSTLGLDYKPAFKDSKEFLTVLIRRPDVEHHKIPLAELKLFYSRKDTDFLSKLDPGDLLRLKGQVFSTALGDVWIQLDKIEILQKVKLDKTKTDAAKAKDDL
jgi:hypothetical protein